MRTLSYRHPNPSEDNADSPFLLNLGSPWIQWRFLCISYIFLYLAMAYISMLHPNSLYTLHFMYVRYNFSILFLTTAATFVQLDFKEKNNGWVVYSHWIFTANLSCLLTSHSCTHFHHVTLNFKASAIVQSLYVLILCYYVSHKSLILHGIPTCSNYLHKMYVWMIS